MTRQGFKFLINSLVCRIIIILSITNVEYRTKSFIQANFPLEILMKGRLLDVGRIAMSGFYMSQ